MTDKEESRPHKRKRGKSKKQPHEQDSKRRRLDSDDNRERPSDEHPVQTKPNTTAPKGDDGTPHAAIPEQSAGQIPGSSLKRTRGGKKFKSSQKAEGTAAQQLVEDDGSSQVVVHEQSAEMAPSESLKRVRGGKKSKSSQKAERTEVEHSIGDDGSSKVVVRKQSAETIPGGSSKRLRGTKKAKSMGNHEPGDAEQRPGTNKAPPQSEVEEAKQSSRTKGAKPKSNANLVTTPEAESVWELSECTGGSFLHIDPIFSEDERFLMVATAAAVHVYSISNSLLVRTLRPQRKNGRIAALALSKVNPDVVYVSANDGSIDIWNWANGSKLAGSTVGGRLAGLEMCSIEGGTEEVLYTLHQKKKSSILAHKITISGGSAIETATIFETDACIHSFKVVGGGRVIVASRTYGIVVGLLEGGSSPFDKGGYVFRSVDYGFGVTCFDARIGIRPSAESTSESSKKSKKKQFKDNPRATDMIVDLVVGDSRGTMHVSHDFLNGLLLAEKPKGGAAASIDLSPRNLHWHRQAVGAVKWSLDGNYIISGGRESVLVIWQQETAKKQYLPDLPSAIDNIRVSPSGASYAIRLADNSVTVLSTSELKARAHVAGIQSRNVTFADSEKAQISSASGTDPYNSRPLQAPWQKLSRVPCVISSTDPTRFLLAVPDSQPATEAIDHHLPAPFLQTFDIASGRHVSRQAMTRNHTLNLNVGPNGERLWSPDVKYMRISVDGRWLTTVESWLPSRKDIEHLATTDEHAFHERGLRREVLLKFWLWDSEQKVWTLETQVDSPHPLPDSRSPGTVFDVAADPSATGFATIGEDRCVRTWKPKTRTRNELVVTKENKQPQVVWARHHVVELEGYGEDYAADEGEADIPRFHSPMVARVAYSFDGSVLAACHQSGTYSRSTPVYLLDAHSGSVRHTLSSLVSEVLYSLAFSGRHLIVLSKCLTVWDLVADSITFRLELPATGHLEMMQRFDLSHLAVNPVDGSFAFALPYVKSQKKTNQRCTTRLLVMSPSTTVPLYAATLRIPVTGLTTTHSSVGFVLLDGAAQIRVLRPATSAGLHLLKPIAEPNGLLSSHAVSDTAEADESPDEEINVAEDDGVDAAPDDTLLPAIANGKHVDEDMQDGRAMNGMEGDDRPVVRPQELTEVLGSGPSFALMPVRDMFRGVVGLFGRRPPEAIRA